MKQSEQSSSSSQNKTQDQKLLFVDTMIDHRQEAEDQLQSDNLSPQDRFKALDRINNSQHHLYGDNSVEALRSESELGFFLIDHSEPEIALKHFNTARSIEKNNQNVNEEDSAKLAIGTAKAYLALDENHTKQAEEVLQPYTDTQFSSPSLRYNRDMVKAQIHLTKENYSKALETFKEAQKSLRELNSDQDSKEEAELYLKMSKAAEKGRRVLDNSDELSNEYNSKAQSILSHIDSDQSNNRVKFVLPESAKPRSAKQELKIPLDNSINSFDLNEFELLTEIGSGAFAKVYKIKEKESGTIYAAKIMNKSMEDTTKESKRQLSREVNILSKLNHPAILKFIGYSPVNFKNKPKPVIVTEYAENSSLDKLIQLESNSIADKNWNDTRKLITIYGIASALSYLHSHGIIHRDLKPANILMNDVLCPKIADFGLSKMDHQNAESISMKSTNGFKGTPIYMSPEIWARSEYTPACDVYAFGLIVFEILTSEKPFPEDTYYDLPQKVQNGVRPEFNSQVPECYQELISQCWDNDPKLRPPFDEILRRLKTDPRFITPTVDEGDFLNYIDYLDEYKTSFADNKRMIHINEFIRNSNREGKEFQSISISIPAVTKENKNDESGKPDSQEDSSNPENSDKPADADHPDYKLLCPYEYFSQFNDDRKRLVQDAEEDPYKQYIVGNFFVEGIEGFPQDTDLGIIYLDKAIKAGCIEAVNYYCNLLIKGEFVQMDLEKAGDYLVAALKSHDATVYLLYGKVMRKFEKYDEARKYFKKSSNGGCPDGMYEYGKMCYRGEGKPQDLEEANLYFDLSKRNGCYKTYDFIIRQEKEAERKRKREQMAS